MLTGSVEVVQRSEMWRGRLVMMSMVMLMLMMLQMLVVLVRMVSPICDDHGFVVYLGRGTSAGQSGVMSEWGGSAGQILAQMFLMFLLQVIRGSLGVVRSSSPHGVCWGLRAGWTVGIEHGVGVGRGAPLVAGVRVGAAELGLVVPNQTDHLDGIGLNARLGPAQMLCEVSSPGVMVSALVMTVLGFSSCFRVLDPDLVQE